MDKAADDASLGRTCFRKAAWRSLPLLGMGYLFAYMDRVNIGFAAAQMNTDLGFSAAVYGFGGGLFFLSYALMEVPSNLLMQRFGARIWIGRIMLTWGILAAATMFVRTAWQFYAMRLLLGAAEAGFFPAVVVYLSYWFPLERRSRALSLFYVAFPLSSVVMGALAGSLLSLDGAFHLRGWQWLLLAEGLPAAFLGLAVFRWLPERPNDVSWLTAEEKGWLQARLATHPEAGDAENPPAIVEVLTHPRVLWLGLVNALFLGTSTAFTLTAPQVLGLRTGFSPASVGYLISLAGLAGAAAMLANAWIADRWRAHFLPLIGALLVCGAGYAALALGSSATAAVTAYLATMVGASAFNAVFMVLVSRVLRPQALVVGCAGVNMIGQLGSFVLPTAYGLIQQHAGRLDGPLLFLAPSFFIAAVIIALLRVSVARRTARLATLAAE